MISVIVPVYNTEKYLSRCVDSILASSCQEFEIILVNDGSTDHSPELCHAYADREKRIKYVKQENHGVSTARNRGIRESQGEWIVFVDSDDFISADFLSIIAQETCQSYDLLLFDSIWIRQRGRKQKKERLTEPVSYVGESCRIPFIEKMLRMEPLEEGHNSALPSACGKAYRRSILIDGNVEFPAGIAVGEDRIFNITYWLQMNSCLYIPEVVYFADQRMDSATHVCHPNYLQENSQFVRELKELLNQAGIFNPLEAAYVENVLAEMAAVLIRGIFSPQNTRSYREKCELCRGMRKEAIYDKALRDSDKHGNIPRRLLLYFFKRRCYRITALICRMSFVYLYVWRRM